MLDIEATGVVAHNGDPASEVGPDGADDPGLRQFNVVGAPSDANHGALIGRLDEHTPYFVVGGSLTYICKTEGELYIGINDVGLANNRGVFTATITVQG